MEISQDAVCTWGRGVLPDGLLRRMAHVWYQTSPLHKISENGALCPHRRTATTGRVAGHTGTQGRLTSAS